MVSIQPELEQSLESIARRSNRSLHELVNDVLGDYAKEIDHLESALNDGGGDAPGVADPQPVYVRRRDSLRRQ